MRIELKVLNKEFYGDKKTGAIDSIKYLPTYATDGSAGIDLITTTDIVLHPGETVRIPTGLAIWVGSSGKEIPPFSVVGLLVPRSGLGSRGLILANTIGVIDSDYRGELLVHVWNRNEAIPAVPYLKGKSKNKRNLGKILRLEAGDRFAQLLFVPVIKTEFVVVDQFSDPTIMRGGFGSTGK